MLKAGKLYLAKEKSPLNGELWKAMFRFTLNALAKHYLNIEVKNVAKILKEEEKSVLEAAKENGHRVKDNFIYFNSSN